MGCGKNGEGAQPVILADYTLLTHARSNTHDRACPAILAIRGYPKRSGAARRHEKVSENVRIQPSWPLESTPNRGWGGREGRTQS